MTECASDAMAFANYGIDDGTALISRAYHDLAVDGHRTPRVSAEYAERIATSFRRVFVRTAPVPLIPEPVDAAIDDATEAIVHRILGDPTADLRTDVLPAFYRIVAHTYCTHVESGGDPGAVGITDADRQGKGAKE